MFPRRVIAVKIVLQKQPWVHNRSISRLHNSSIRFYSEDPECGVVLQSYRGNLQFVSVHVLVT